MTKEEFAKSYAYLGNFYNLEYTAQEIELHYEFFKNINFNVMIKSLKDIIKTSKFPPKVSEILAQCESNKDYTQVEVIELMKKDGYFKKGYVELSPDKELMNYQKALMFVKNGNIPSWLLKDMREYIKNYQEISNSQTKLLGV